MKLARLLVVGAIAVSLSIAFVVDQEPRPTVAAETPEAVGVPEASEDGVWFCPGGSSPDGLAAVSLELINVGSTPASAVIAGVRSGSGTEARELTEFVDVG